jgi:ferrochelatase
VYKELWTENGSPLLFHSKNVKNLLQKELAEEYEVFLAMRYKNPSIPDVLEEMRWKNFDKIIVVPMFPQYASASTGSALEEVMRELCKWWVIPEIRMISQYYNHPLYIDAFVERGKQYNLSEYDHILFSYHGLPERQVDKVYKDDLCKDHDCEHEITEENKLCYKATCYATTRLLAEKLNIPQEKYTVCFQSRLDKKWLEPFSDKVVEECAKKGMKKILVFSPAFTADCLETTIEIGEEYQELFEEHGGEKVQLVESLNSHPLWIQCLKSLVTER